MKYQGIIYDIMSIPLKRYELLIAFVSSAVLRGLIVGTATYLTAIFFVDFHIREGFFTALYGTKVFIEPDINISGRDVFNEGRKAN